jgi:uncharacterized DUF497 family protein
MRPISIIWDLDDDPDGNVQHIEEHSVSTEEVEDVLEDPESDLAVNRSESGNNLTFGYTSDGRYLAVVWEHVDDDPLTVKPITAYDAPEPKSKRRQRRRK